MWTSREQATTQHGQEYNLWAGRLPAGPAASSPVTMGPVEVIVAGAITVVEDAPGQDVDAEIHAAQDACARGGYRLIPDEQLLSGGSGNTPPGMGHRRFESMSSEEQAELQGRASGLPTSGCTTGGTLTPSEAAGSPTSRQWGGPTAPAAAAMDHHDASHEEARRLEEERTGSGAESSSRPHTAQVALIALPNGQVVRVPAGSVKFEEVFSC